MTVLNTNSWKWRFHFIVNLVGLAQTRVVHRQQEAFDFEGRVQLGLDDFNGIQQFADASNAKYSH